MTNPAFEHDPNMRYFIERVDVVSTFEQTGDPVVSIAPLELPATVVPTVSPVNADLDMSRSQRRGMVERQERKTLEGILKQAAERPNLVQCTDFPEFFFNGDNETAARTSKRYDIARALCAQCIFKSRCLEKAMERNEKYGLWGGTAANEFDALRRERSSKQ